MGGAAVFHQTPLGLQAVMFDIAPVEREIPAPVDPLREKALEGLPHFWRLSRGRTDVIIEKCGYPAHIYVDRLEDPEYKHSKHCPWNGKHDHKPYWDRFPTGWSSES